MLETTQDSSDSKLFNILGNILQNIKSREIFSTNGLIKTVKTGINGFYEILSDKLNAGSTNTDLELIKL
jgi:hypothetical protein